MYVVFMCVLEPGQLGIAPRKCRDALETLELADMGPLYRTGLVFPCSTDTCAGQCPQSLGRSRYRTIACKKHIALKYRVIWITVVVRTVRKMS